MENPLSQNNWALLSALDEITTRCLKLRDYDTQLFLRIYERSVYLWFFFSPRGPRISTRPAGPMDSREYVGMDLCMINQGRRST